MLQFAIECQATLLTVGGQGGGHCVAFRDGGIGSHRFTARVQRRKLKTAEMLETWDPG